MKCIVQLLIFYFLLNGQCAYSQVAAVKEPAMVPKTVPEPNIAKGVALPNSPATSGGLFINKAVNKLGSAIVLYSSYLIGKSFLHKAESKGDSTTSIVSSSASSVPSGAVKITITAATVTESQRDTTTIYPTSVGIGNNAPETVPYNPNNSGPEKYVDIRIALPSGSNNNVPDEVNVVAACPYVRPTKTVYFQSRTVVTINNSPVTFEPSAVTSSIFNECYGSSGPANKGSKGFVNGDSGNTIGRAQFHLDDNKQDNSKDDNFHPISSFRYNFKVSSFSLKESSSVSTHDKSFANDNHKTLSSEALPEQITSNLPSQTSANHIQSF